MNSNRRDRADDRTDTWSKEEPARFWPLALLFIAFTSLPAACHWPAPDARNPIATASTTPAHSDSGVAKP